MESIGSIAEFRGLTPSALAALALRLDGSRKPEHMVYREVEIDEFWRFADALLSEARAGVSSSAETIRLERVKAVLHEAHDLLGDADDAAGAAELIRMLGRELPPQLVSASAAGESPQVNGDGFRMRSSR